MSETSLQPLYSRQEIATKIEHLARQIDDDYAGLDVLMIAVLKGSFLFAADLIRALKIPVQIEFVQLASYGSGTHSSGQVEFIKDVAIDLRGRHILVVEDIVDSGRTLAAFRERLLGHHPASLKVCSLIDKRARRETEVPVDYSGFTLDDGFIVGYGLDLGERYRDLPDIHLLETE